LAEASSRPPDRQATLAHTAHRHAQFSTTTLCVSLSRSRRTAGEWAAKPLGWETTRGTHRSHRVPATAGAPQIAQSIGRVSVRLTWSWGRGDLWASGEVELVGKKLTASGCACQMDDTRNSAGQ